MRAVRRCAVAAALAATPAWAAEPWLGVWSAEPEWCVNADHVGSRTPAPVELTATEFLGYENSCTLGRVDQIGGLQAWRFTLECQSEGSTYDDRFVGLLEGPDVLWLIWGAAEAVRFERCR